MINLLFLAIALVACSVAAYRLMATRNRRRLRQARQARRAEEERQWNEATGQFMGDDWRS